MRLSLDKNLGDRRVATEIEETVKHGADVTGLVI